MVREPMFGLRTIHKTVYVSFGSQMCTNLNKEPYQPSEVHGAASTAVNSFLQFSTVRILFLPPQLMLLHLFLKMFLRTY